MGGGAAEMRDRLREETPGGDGGPIVTVSNDGWFTTDRGRRSEKGARVEKEGALD